MAALNIFFITKAGCRWRVPCHARPGGCLLYTSQDDRSRHAEGGMAGGIFRERGRDQQRYPARIRGRGGVHRVRVLNGLDRPPGSIRIFDVPVSDRRIGQSCVQNREHPDIGRQAEPLGLRDRLRDDVPDAGRSDGAGAAGPEQGDLGFVRRAGRAVRRSEAVSYTHLDVYKRQNLDDP